MSANSCRLSVLLITYNHEAFVEKAIESVLMQNIGEPFEVLVADDCSTDGTLRIVRRMADANPGIRFRFLDADRNVGITKNYRRAFAAVESDYVAVLEGDDYWVDTHKLQAQIDFLDRHRECGLCSVNYYVYEEDHCRFTPRMPPGEGYILIGARELIADNLVGNFSTCMYRTQVLRDLPVGIFEIRSYDWAINICVAKHGLIGFLRSPMSVYRIHKSGSWSLLPHLEKIRAQLQLIPEYDRVTGGVFNGEFSELSGRLTAHLAELEATAPEHAPAVSAFEVAPPPQPNVPWYRDLTPPFVFPMARMLLPPFLKRIIVRWLIRR